MRAEQSLAVPTWADALCGKSNLRYGGGTRSVSVRWLWVCFQRLLKGLLTIRAVDSKKGLEPRSSAFCLLVSANGRERVSGSRERKGSLFCFSSLLSWVDLFFALDSSIHSFRLSSSTFHFPTQTLTFTSIRILIAAMLEVVTRPTKALLYGSALFRYIPRQTGNATTKQGASSERDWTWAIYLHADPRTARTIRTL